MELRFNDYIHENLAPGFSPYYIYDIYVSFDLVGKIVLREGTIKERYIDGHIGYSIYEEYRGHHYSLQACYLLKNQIQALGYQEVILTCDPQNKASKRIIQQLGCEYKETVEIPRSMKKLFTKEERQKEIYIWRI